MKRNTRGFFSWQGNNLEPTRWTNYLIFGIGLLIIFLFFIFKRKIKKSFESRNRYLFFFKNETTMFQSVGVVGLLFIIARISIMWIQGYPLYWEGLGLHFCRFLILLIFLFLAFGKIDWIKYLVYITFPGFIFGVLFAYESSDVINKLGSSNSEWTSNYPIGEYHAIPFDDIKVFKNVKLVNIEQFERLMIWDGITHYGDGWDNWFIYDIYIAHLALLLIPTYIYFAKNQKISVVEFHRIQVIFFILAIIFWIFNILLDLSPDVHWRSNFWYFGVNRNNNMSETIGVLSEWPTNIITYSVIALIITAIIHLIYLTSDKFIFFEDKKFLRIIKSKNLKEHIQTYKNTKLRNICKEVVGIKKK